MKPIRRVYWSYLVSVGKNHPVELGRFEERVSINVSAYRIMHVNSPWLGGVGISTVIGRV